MFWCPLFLAWLWTLLYARKAHLRKGALRPHQYYYYAHTPIPPTHPHISTPGYTQTPPLPIVTRSKKVTWTWTYWELSTSLCLPGLSQGCAYLVTHLPGLPWESVYLVTHLHGLSWGSVLTWFAMGVCACLVIHLPGFSQGVCAYLVTHLPGLSQGVCAYLVTHLPSLSQGVCAYLVTHLPGLSWGGGAVLIWSPTYLVSHRGQCLPGLSLGFCAYLVTHLPVWHGGGCAYLVIHLPGLLWCLCLPLAGSRCVRELPGPPQPADQVWEGRHDVHNQAGLHPLRPLHARGQVRGGEPPGHVRPQPKVQRAPWWVSVGHLGHHILPV